MNSRDLVKGRIKGNPAAQQRPSRFGQPQGTHTSQVLLTGCTQRGGIKRTVRCSSCAGTVSLKVFHCEVHDECALAEGAGVKVCSGCNERTLGRVKQHDERTLWPAANGKRFNASLIEYKGQLVCCFRNGWKGSDVFVGRLDDQLRPVGEVRKLNLRHPECNYGREDPRLFIHDDRLHVSFIGVVGGLRIRHTNVLYARLTDEFAVDQLFHPEIPGRQLWEKNHSYFSHDGDLYAVYSINPHRIIKVSGREVQWRHETLPAFNWHGGEMRGGASPVRVGDEYWSFFHDRIEDRGHRIYRTGLYTFSARPPFRPVRYIPRPLLTADRNTKPSDQYASVVFACGAVRYGDDWIVSHGVHDRWTEFHKWNHAELEAQLVPCGPPAWWTQREGAQDSLVYNSVVLGNEYLLPGRMDGAKVLDVGAHVGAFAHACVQRGAAAVHCYEPVGENYQYLEANCEYMPEVVPHMEAVGRTDGWAGATLTPETGVENFHSAAYRVGPDPDGGIPMTSLRTAIERLGHVDVLKMDCEGAEWEALAGAGGSLQHVDLILGEWHEFDSFGRVQERSQLHALLPGFAVHIEHLNPSANYGRFTARRTCRN